LGQLHWASGDLNASGWADGCPRQLVGATPGQVVTTLAQ
jgi:hypothetical protein